MDHFIHQTKSYIFILFFIFIFANISFANQSASYPVLTEAILAPTNDSLGSPLSEYGKSVDIYGQYAVVGAPETHPKGVVYVFKLNGSSWEKVASLQSSDTQPIDKFGISVNIYKNRIVVGARSARLLPGYHVGAVYIFDLINNQWQQTAIIQPNELNYLVFGFSTALYENRIIVGSYGNHNPNAENSGAAYIFDKINDSWIQTAKLVPDDILGGDRFGYSVSIFQDRVLIGSPYSGVINNRHGAAYLFQLSNNQWAQEKKLIASDPQENVRFGSAVSLYKKRALVSTPFIFSESSGYGAVYDFEITNNNWIQKQKITVSNGRNFGNSIDQDDLQIVIGNNKRSDVDNGIMGSAYIFEEMNGNWLEKQEILPKPLSSDSNFGASVGTFQGYLLIGDNTFSANLTTDSYSSGSAYFYKTINNTWEQTQHFIPPDGIASDSFGNAVSLQDNRAAVAAVNDVSDNSNGTVYIYDYIDGFWKFTSKIKPAISKFKDYFGHSVSLSGDRLLVGASGVDETGVHNGAAYIFELIDGKWTEVITLYPDSLGEKEYFGSSVSLVGNTALIGAYGNDEKNINSGAVYVYNFDGSSWQLSHKLFATDSDEGDLFGYRVKLSGKNTALISAVLDDEGEVDSGAAYVFELLNGTWRQSGKLLPNAPQEQQWFSYSMDIDNDVIVIGSPLYNSSSINSGKTYVYQKNNSQWTLSQQLTGEDLATNLFGYSVSTHSNKIYSKNRLGKIFLFELSNNSWNETGFFNTLTSSYNNNINSFLDRILVGADNFSESVGRAFIYNISQTNFTVAGNVTGLTQGNAFYIKINNNVEYKYITDNGSFIFENELINNAGYNVEIHSQPQSPLQKCTILNTSGLITNTNVQDIVIECIVVNVFSNSFENL